MLPAFIGLGIFIALMCAFTWEFMEWFTERHARKQELVCEHLQEFNGRVHVIVKSSK